MLFRSVGSSLCELYDLIGRRHDGKRRFASGHPLSWWRPRFFNFESPKLLKMSSEIYLFFRAILIYERASFEGNSRHHELVGGAELWWLRQISEALYKQVYGEKLVE